ncbi:hypothetical protein ACSBR2_003943 [Camellia fascicularis]
MKRKSSQCQAANEDFKLQMLAAVKTTIPSRLVCCEGNPVIREVDSFCSLLHLNMLFVWKIEFSY